MAIGLTLVFAAAIAAVAPLPSAGEAVVEEVKAAYAEVDAKHAAMPPARTTAEKLARLVETDQAGRLVWVERGPALKALSQDQRQAVSKAVADVIVPRDRQNIRMLKALIPEEGWFTRGRDGEQATYDAWILVQHATEEPAFMAEVLKRMGPLVEGGDVSGPNYALLYDRVALQQGRPQRYGSQIKCKDGRPQVAEPVEDYALIDKRRRAIGLTQPQAEYEAQFANVPC